MKILTIATVAACGLLAVSQLAAQVPCDTSGAASGGTVSSGGVVSGAAGGSIVGGSGFCGDSAYYSSGFSGPVTANCVGPFGYPPPGAALYHAAHDNFSPRPVYAYSHAGIDATRQNAWNENQAAIHPWHCNYYYWRWGVPTALVVPPTAAFQSEYNWGVAQTKSLPIYHQFGRTYVGDGGVAPGQFLPKPYWPYSTHQFGVYPVRAPY